MSIVEDVADRLRDLVEEHEEEMQSSGMLLSLFGDPGRCDSSRMMSKRRDWARDLALLRRLERGTGRLSDEWWRGPEGEHQTTRREEAIAHQRNPKRRLRLQRMV